MSDSERVERENKVRRKDRPPKARVNLIEVVRSYRLLGYVKPYRWLLALMFGIILVYAGCHFGEVVLVRELMKEGLWIAPEPEPSVTISEVIDGLPEPVRPLARRAAGESLRANLAAILTTKQFKRIEPEAIDRAERKIQKNADHEVKFAEIVRELFSPFDPKVIPALSRQLYLEMSKSVLVQVGPKLTATEAAGFRAASDTGFAPPPERKVDSRRIGILCLALVGFAILVGLAVYFRSVVKAKIIAGATLDVRNDLCDHLLELDMRFFASRSSGDVISRQTNDIVAGTKALMSLFDELAVEPFIALAYAGAAFYFSWHLALVMCTLLIFLPVLLLPIIRRVKKYGRQKLERIAELMMIMSEIYQGTRVTKAFRIEQKKHEEFREANERYVSRLFKTMRLRGLTGGISEGFASASLALVLFLAAYLVTTDLFGVQLDPPDVLMFAGSMLMLSRAVKGIAKAYPDFMESVVASERVFEVLDVKPEIQDAPDAVDLPPISRSIAFRGVNFAYAEQLVLKDITFEARRGEVIAVVGHSGAGKSTLLDLIPRFYDPLSGRIEIDGVDIRKATLTSLRGQIAVVSQDPFLFQTTIMNNIRYGRLGATDDEIRTAATAANIDAFIATLPDGYDTLCGERGVKLSGGQRQRITIARAILKDAPILILDEATSSLDIESEQLVREALNRLMEHRTTFVIAHRLSTVQHADRIVVLRLGELLESGTHAELVERKGEYWRLYKTEFESNGLGD